MGGGVSFWFFCCTYRVRLVVEGRKGKRSVLLHRFRSQVDLSFASWLAYISSGLIPIYHAITVYLVCRYVFEILYMFGTGYIFIGVRAGVVGVILTPSVPQSRFGDKPVYFPTDLSPKRDRGPKRVKLVSRELQELIRSTTAYT